MRFRGIAYRAHNPQWSWSPLSGEGARLHGGRFNPAGVPALYVSLSPLTAVLEMTQLRQPMQPILLCSYEVDIEPIFDPLDPEQRKAHAVTDSELLCPGWRTSALGGGIPASHALAERLIAAGYAGMRYPSFAPGAGRDDLNLVLWRWGSGRPHRVRLIDDERRLVPAASRRAME